MNDKIIRNVSGLTNAIVIADQTNLHCML